MLRALGKIGRWRHILPICLLVMGMPSAAHARTAEDVSGNINQTGRVLPMSVPLRDSTRQFGDVMIRIEVDDTVRVSKAALLQVLDSALIKELATAFEAAPEYPTIEDIRRIGLQLSFDKQSLQLVVEFKSNQRMPGDISMASPPVRRSGAPARPAMFSAYLNFAGQADYIWNSSQTALRFDTLAVARIGNFVLESEFALQNDVNALTCPVNAVCNLGLTSGIKRQGSRMVYDWPDNFNRLTIGDARTTAAAFQGSPDILGLSLEHSQQKLAPGQQIRMTGSNAFAIERASTIEVLVNGAAVQHLRLGPGRYNLRDLPLQAGANDITLLITDDSGAQKTLRFTTYSNYNLLSEGASEWAVTGGVPSYVDDNEVKYRERQHIGSLFWRYGLTSGMTAELQAQADDDVMMAGGGALAASPFGLWGLQLAASRSDVGTGGGLRATWELAGNHSAGALRMAFEAHTPAFRSPGQYVTAINGIIYPTYQFSQNYSASYSRTVFADWQATLSAMYAVANKTYDDFGPLQQRGDRYHVDLSLSRPLFENAVVSTTVGYSNEIYNRSFSDGIARHLGDTKGSLWAGVRLFWRPDSKTNVTVSTDTLNQRSLASGTYNSAQGVEAWSTTLNVFDDRRSGIGDVNASARYQGQRGEIAVAHDVGTVLLPPHGDDQLTFGRYKSTIRAATAFVYADGHAAISAPIRGDGGFAILHPHETIRDKEIIAGTSDHIQARSDWFGPAVVPNLPAYVPRTIPLDVADLPLGYSLGSGGFDIHAPFRAGYALEVGSGYSVSAFGELVDTAGQPLPMAAGTASNGRRSVTVFTNQGGKFAADGLAPGRWTLTMETDDGPALYIIDVPPGTQGLVRLGQLRPGKG